MPLEQIKNIKLLSTIEVVRPAAPRSRHDSFMNDLAQ